MPSINLPQNPRPPNYNPDTGQFEGASPGTGQATAPPSLSVLPGAQPQANPYQTGGSLYGLGGGGGGGISAAEREAASQAEAVRLGQAQREAAVTAQAQQQGADQYGQMRGEQAAATERNIAQSSKVTRPGIVADENAARAAAFARAKDQASMTARASLDALTTELTGRGIVGSGEDFLRTSGVVNRAAQGVNELTREQYIQDLNRAAEVADQTYSGNIAQRGQDLGLSPSILGLAGRLY